MKRRQLLAGAAALPVAAFQQRRPRIAALRHRLPLHGPAASGRHRLSPLPRLWFPRDEIHRRGAQTEHGQAGRAMPVFSDKHLSYDWTKAKQIYAWSQELHYPLMETLQCFVKRRKGGETGIHAVEHLEAVWKAAEQGHWSKEGRSQIDSTNCYDPVFSRLAYLLFSDVPSDRILKWERGEVTVFRENSHGAKANTFDHQGRLLPREIGRVTRTEKDGKITVLAGGVKEPSAAVGVLRTCVWRPAGRVECVTPPRQRYSSGRSRPMAARNRGSRSPIELSSRLL